MTSLTTPKSKSTYDTEVAEQVTRLLRLFDRRRLAASEAAELIRDYTQVLGGLPLAAIREAVMRFSRGQVDGASKSFAPTPAELYTEADRIRRAEELKVAFERKRPALPPPEKIEQPRLISPEKMDELRAVVGLRPMFVRQ